MTDLNPITPPPELVQEWTNEWVKLPLPTGLFAQYIATQAARWAADQELDACCVLMDDWGLDAADLIAARRTRQPSLKEQALTVLNDASNRLDAAHENLIRRALEQLND